MTPHFVLGLNSWMHGRRGARSWSRGTIGKPFNLGRTPSMKTTRRGGISGPEGAATARKNDDVSGYAEDHMVV